MMIKTSAAMAAILLQSCTTTTSAWSSSSSPFHRQNQIIPQSRRHVTSHRQTTTTTKLNMTPLETTSFLTAAKFTPKLLPLYTETAAVMTEDASSSSSAVDKIIDTVSTAAFLTTNPLEKPILAEKLAGDLALNTFANEIVNGLGSVLPPQLGNVSPTVIMIGSAVLTFGVCNFILDQVTKEKETALTSTSSENNNDSFVKKLPLLLSLPLFGLIGLKVVQEITTASSISLPAFASALSVDVSSLDKLSVDLSSFEASIPPQVYSALEQVSPYLSSASPTTTALLLVGSSIFTYSLISTLLSIGKSTPPPTSPYPLGKYDATSAREYFDTKPWRALKRAIEIGVKSGGFGIKLGLDYARDQLFSNADRRAFELSDLLTDLGPSFIKIGQSLSIRTDLLSPAYVRGLRKLQDQVPPFSSQEAREIIEKELGERIETIFLNFPKEPIAAASLGQVFKATLRETNQEVAVKVQRPAIMEQIALDMYLIREIAPWAKRTFNLNTDTVGTVDAWGTGFVDELDYLAEAKNGMEFTESIQSTPLSSVVFAPPVLEEYTTDKVLTTEWVVGERLDKSSKADVTILCSIAMNSYLTMMLETGTLHCDPHPGNLLRTTDGKLCILDWGMVTKIRPDLQVTLIEHMAHLTSADYDEIPRDLLLLGFIPESKADLIDDSGIVEVLADIYGAWTGGGGAAAINVNKVVADLQDLTAEKGNLFQIPPYFAYIAKSFSVLEGIGLSNDNKYSIINECLPYVSKRLLTDKADRMGGALSTFIFGPDKYDTEKRIVDYDRVEQLVTGFGSYQTSASGALLGKETSRMDLIENLSDQILDLVVTEEETPLQTIFIEQLAKMISASSRSIWADLREASGTLPSGRSVLGTIVDPLGLFRTSPIVRMNELDVKTVETTRSLLELMQSQIEKTNKESFDLSTLTNNEVQELSRMLVRKIWERRRGVLQTSNRLATMLLKLTADKLESGERDVLVLPRPGEDGVEAKDLTVSDGRIHDVVNSEVSNSPTVASSERLSRARSILSELKELEEKPGGVEDHQVVDLLTSKETSSSSRPVPRLEGEEDAAVVDMDDESYKESAPIADVSSGKEEEEKDEVALQR